MERTLIIFSYATSRTAIERRRQQPRRNSVSALLLLTLLVAGCAPAAGGAAEEVADDVGPVVVLPQPGNAGAYDCRADPGLDAAPAIPAADTAGLGARIARHFPGWRLSTEREIACRFPLIDGSRPEQNWGADRWGSGRAWWVWSGDFDGDDRPDRLVLLTAESDPGQDLLGVLFDDGTAAEVTEPDGWGVVVAPPKGATLESPDGQGSLTLEGDGITVVFWEKAATLYVWNGEEFIEVELAD